jgi:membrane-anchored glycerophosphoryl diester phosphodiesterase (GDPDase)
MSQTRRNSLLEATVSTIAGIIINASITPLINYSLCINMSGEQIVGSTIIFTLVSLARSYFIRRIFTKLSNRGQN